MIQILEQARLKMSAPFRNQHELSNGQMWSDMARTFEGHMDELKPYVYIRDYLPSNFVPNLPSRLGELKFKPGASCALTPIRFGPYRVLQLDFISVPFDENNPLPRFIPGNYDYRYIGRQSKKFLFEKNGGSELTDHEQSMLPALRSLSAVLKQHDIPHMFGGSVALDVAAGTTPLASEHSDIVVIIPTLSIAKATRVLKAEGIVKSKDPSGLLHEASVSDDAGNTLKLIHSLSISSLTAEVHGKSYKLSLMGASDHPADPSKCQTILRWTTFAQPTFYRSGNDAVLEINDLPLSRPEVIVLANSEYLFFKKNRLKTLLDWWEIMPKSGELVEHGCGIPGRNCSSQEYLSQVRNRIERAVLGSIVYPDIE